LLRGPQTPGELRARASRMADVRDVSEIEDALVKLAAREDGPFVVRLPREPGRRESRFAHLFSDEIPATAAEHAERSGANAAVRSEQASNAGQADSVEERLRRLEELVADLRAEVDRLRGSG
jgi:uncharacterized protein YceH (UPF0502 family)